MSLSKSKWTLLKLQLEFELEKYDIAFYSILQNDRSTLLMEKKYLSIVMSFRVSLSDGSWSFRRRLLPAQMLSWMALNVVKSGNASSCDSCCRWVSKWACIASRKSNCFLIEVMLFSVGLGEGGQVGSSSVGSSVGGLSVVGSSVSSSSSLLSYILEKIIFK